jgi:hypothetical protein
MGGARPLTAATSFAKLNVRFNAGQSILQATIPSNLVRV